MDAPSRFNDTLFLLALGIIQPASPQEVVLFLQAAFSQVTSWPSEEALARLVARVTDQRCVAAVGKGLYSLTRGGNQRLSVGSRHIRDKLRLSLLRQCRDASLVASEAGVKGLGGDAPPSDTSSSTKEAPRPTQAGPAPSRPEAIRRRAGLRWPRVVEQLSKVGLVTLASDRSRLAPPRYYSYGTLKALQRASGDNGPERDMTLRQLALAIGVSPRLISAIIHQPSKHYRAFELPKKAGGMRTIHAPRFFLKTIQYWLGSHVLADLRVHAACHAYVLGRSILTNAELHAHKRYVANLDIKAFFDSVRIDRIQKLLVDSGIGSCLARTVSELVTYQCCLPQGAPTSPLVSNAFLFDFDTRITQACARYGVVYTRYADDITLSSDIRDAVTQAIDTVTQQLGLVGLELNRKKTRVASSHSSQRVTGLVVNTEPRPPRGYRRAVRSEFDHALRDRAGVVSREELNRLRGHFSYLRSFPILAQGREVQRYAEILGKLTTVPG